MGYADKTLCLHPVIKALNMPLDGFQLRAFKRE